MVSSARLQGQVVLVVGAHGGLGSEVARASAREGATVVLLGRRVPKLNQVYDQLVADGSPQPAIYPLDLEGASPADYEQLGDTLRREFGRLDGVLFAAAECKGLASIENADPMDVVRAIHVNLTAPILLLQALLPLLRESSSGARVVLLMDSDERVQRAFWGGYGVSKAGLQALLRILADELEGSAVKVMGMCPGPMRTNLRSRIFFAEDPAQWPAPQHYAPQCVAMLAGFDATPHGQIWVSAA
ncbi:MAG: SDR family NAD(P)-dependent oxidoreductase [Aquimonas sp.]|jgi:NAD(P)-dependent dehydrogenase (short-subunit alcohol dehydrogenase family)|nr:SDR family NAD(P)-dependent oxidoreductase [Xanthomonadales bacterium]MCC6504805.1 SDR family NAD(P)-dependent oxidoreductase [Aquimonas sp.]